MFSFAAGTAKWLIIADTVGGFLFHGAWAVGLIDPTGWLASVILN